MFWSKWFKEPEPLEVGGMYKLRDFEAEKLNIKSNPFKRSVIVQIKALKDGWVSYGFMSGIDNPEDYESKHENNFRQLYTPLGVKYVKTK